MLHQPHQASTEVSFSFCGYLCSGACAQLCAKTESLSSSSKGYWFFACVLVKSLTLPAMVCNMSVPLLEHFHELSHCFLLWTMIPERCTVFLTEDWPNKPIVYLVPCAAWLHATALLELSVVYS